MKRFLALLAVLMWLTIGFAFAGGGSEVGDGRSSHANGSIPIPMPGDAPTDPKQLVNPSTLIFAYTPVEDPAVYAKAWDGFGGHR